MAEPRDPYSIESEEPQPPPPPGGTGNASAGSDSGKPRIEAPRLLDDFEEDADFERDPELERVITGKDREATVIGRGDLVGVRGDSGEEFGRPLFGEPLHWAVAGAVLLLGALIVAGINAGNHHVFRIALTLYNVLLHTGTGVAAVFIAAYVTNTRVKRPELTAARMFVAVAAFMLIFRLNINFFGPDYRTWRLEELVLASLVYVGLVAGSFRLVRWYPLAILVGAHFVIWLVVQVGMELSAAVAAAPTPPPPAVTAPVTP
jgi:hypothetical protein